MGLMGGEKTRVGGNGARGGGWVSHGPDLINAKRAACKPERIKRQLEDGVPLEELPERGFVRLGKTSTRILIGVDDLSEWDNEEIRRGRRRDKNGGWQGRDPVVVPMALHQEAIKRTFDEAQELMREGLVPAIKYLTGLVESDDAEDRDRIKAVSMIMDRVLGKAVERVEIKTGTEPWEDAIKAAVVPLDAIEVTTEEEDDNAAVDPSP